MDHNNTNQNPKKAHDDTHIHHADRALTDLEIEELLPTPEELPKEPSPLSEAEAEEEAGGDEPTEIPPNLNNEDEEAWKEESIS